MVMLAPSVSSVPTFSFHIHAIDATPHLRGLQFNSQMGEVSFYLIFLSSVKLTDLNAPSNLLNVTKKVIQVFLLTQLNSNNWTPTDE